MYVCISNSRSLIFTMKDKEIEQISVGCAIGLCAWFSEGCKMARLMLSVISGLFNGCRSEERRLEGAGGR